MSHVLVTGSEGLIGKALCTALEKAGNTIERFDIRFHQDHPDFGNILDLDILNAKIKNCDGVVHLAAVSRVVWGEKDPEKCWKTNVVGTHNVVQAIKNSSLKPWMVYASSREVYGQQQNFPVEIDVDYMPLNIYARSKVAAEKLVLQAREEGLYTAVIRYSSVYGRIDDHKDRVVPAFCRRTVLGEPLRIEGLENTLDFTHVDDTVDGTIAVINILETRNSPLLPLHITTGVPTTLKELANLVGTSVGRELNIIEMPSRSYDVSRFWGSTTKTSQILSWQAKISVKVGVQNLVQQFKYLKA